MKSFSNRSNIPLNCRRFLFLILFVGAGFLISSVQLANAANSQKGLTLSPLRNELEIAPGTSLDGILTISNSTTQPVTVHLSDEAFSVINQEYDYAFSSQSDFTKWVTFSAQDIKLLAGESKKVTFNIGVPLSAEPGGRYLSLFASTDSRSDDGVSSRQRVGSLVYLTVLGDVSRIGQLVSLSSPWAIGDESMWSMVLRNSGSTHFHSAYSVSIKDLFGNEVVAKKQSDSLILPGSVRALSNELPAPKIPGVYKVIYEIGLGDTPGKTETRFILYLPLPVGIILLSIVGIATIIFLQRRPKKV